MIVRPLRARRSTARRVIPSVEVLADRTVPAIIVTNAPGGVVMITGDGANDVVEVHDAGNTDPNVFSFTVSSPGQPIKLFSNVKSVTINTGGGNDVVNYVANPNGVDNYLNSVQVNIDLGSGHDNLGISVQGDFDAVAPGVAALRMNVAAGDGNDQVSIFTQVKMLDVGSTVSFNIDLGAGNDSLFAGDDDEGTVEAANASLSYDINTGDGKDTVRILSFVKVDLGGSLTYNVRDGSAKGNNNDLFQIDYTGIMNGLLSIDVSAGQGNDKISSRLSVNGTGVVNGRYRGQAGNDKISVDLIASAPGVETIDINGGAGTDRAQIGGLVEMDDVDKVEKVKHI